MDGSAKPLPEPPGRSTLKLLLSKAYRSEGLAHDALEAALTAAGLAEVPASQSELFDFVKVHIQPSVAVQLGELIAEALTSQLFSELQPTNGPPPSRRHSVARLALRSHTRVKPVGTTCVAVVDSDHYRRITLARALLRQDVRVLVIERQLDILAAASEVGRVAAAVVDLRHPAARALLDGLVGRWPEIGVVLRTDADPWRDHQLARGAARIELQPTTIATETLVQTVLKVCSRPSTAS